MCGVGARIAAMKRRALLGSLPTIALLPAANWLGSSQEKSASAPPATAVYELRVYHVYEGKLDDLLARFRDHTLKIFESHGISNVGYWLPETNTDNKLIYLLAYPSREAREKSWKEFSRSRNASRRHALSLLCKRWKQSPPFCPESGRTQQQCGAV